MLVLSGLTSSICLLCESEDKTSTLSALATRLSLTLCRPSCHNLLYLSGAVSQNKSFLPYVIYTRAFYPRNRKKKSRLQLQAQGKEGTILTLNIDDLKSPKTLVTRLEQITKFLVLFLPKTHLTINGSHYLAGEGQQKVFQANGSRNEAGVAMLISDKVDLNPKLIRSSLTKIRNETQRSTPSTPVCSSTNNLSQSNRTREEDKCSANRKVRYDSLYERH